MNGSPYNLAFHNVHDPTRAQFTYSLELPKFMAQYWITLSDFGLDNELHEDNEWEVAEGGLRPEANKTINFIQGYSYRDKVCAGRVYKGEEASKAFSPYLNLSYMMMFLGTDSLAQAAAPFPSAWKVHEKNNLIAVPFLIPQMGINPGYLSEISKGLYLAVGDQGMRKTEMTLVSELLDGLSAALIRFKNRMEMDGWKRLLQLAEVTSQTRNTTDADIKSQWTTMLDKSGTSFYSSLGAGNGNIAARDSVILAVRAYWAVALDLAEVNTLRMNMLARIGLGSSWVYAEGWTLEENVIAKQHRIYNKGIFTDKAAKRKDRAMSRKRDQEKMEEEIKEDKDQKKEGKNDKKGGKNDKKEGKRGRREGRGGGKDDKAPKPPRNDSKKDRKNSKNGKASSDEILVGLLDYLNKAVGGKGGIDPKDLRNRAHNS